MAFDTTLRQIIEGRLLAYDPTMDLSSGSQAQIKVVDPLVRRLSSDPLSTDISVFIKDLMTQEYPDMVIDGGGELEDVLIKPLQLLMEPLRREIQTTRTNQSVQNADIMSDDEADALGANWVKAREQGNFSTGSVRLYFTSPTNIRVTPDKRCYTAAGLNFYPQEGFYITSTQMLFNRQGSFYYMDIYVQAENPGKEYNVARGDIVGIDDVPGVVKVSNLSSFTDGLPRQDNTTYLGNIPQNITERSLTTKKGIVARTTDLFSSIAALQIVGAGDEGMDRDILKGTGEGFLHIAGTGKIYGNWLFLDAPTYKDDGPNDDIIIQPGDLVRFHKPKAEDPSRTIHEAKVLQVLSTASDEKALIILDTSLFEAHLVVQGRVAIFKPGFISISEVPGGMTQTLRVPDSSIHLGGHLDVFIRPSGDADLQTTLSNVVDDSPKLALLDVATTVDTNIISSPGTDFSARGVVVEDLVVIETGSLAGTYRVLDVGDPDEHSLRVDVIFTSSTSGQRARVISQISIDLVQPKNLKLPFNQQNLADLRVVVGSTLFRFDTTDIQDYGAVAGDVVRVLDGVSAGDYIIVGFDPALGGHGALMDRVAPASDANLHYQVFTAYNGLQRPFVRLKSLEVLDSTGQGTGVVIPYGDAVDMRPIADFEGAGKEVRLLSNDILCFPEASTLWSTLPGMPASPLPFGEHYDTRYSQHLVVRDGKVVNIDADGSNPILAEEVNLPPFTYNGKRDTLLAFTTKKDPNFTADPSGDHRTSDVAEAKIGDSITILDGPNQGDYFIRDLRVLELWNLNKHGHHRVALVRVEPELPSDPMGTAVSLINDYSGTTGVSPITAADLIEIIHCSTDWEEADFWSDFIERLYNTLTHPSIGFDIDEDELSTIMTTLSRTGYSIGPSAKGYARCYFSDPASVEFRFSDDPTIFQHVTDETKNFRLSPDMPPAQIMPESEEATDPTQWSRDGYPSDVDGFYFFGLMSGALPLRGVRTGDIFEFRPAINTLVAYKEAKSSWLCITQAGSNIVQLIVPNAAGGLKGLTAISPGQLFFIDSGPDIGAYTVTRILEDELANLTPPAKPVVRFQVDRVLTHSTLSYPADPAPPVSFSLLDVRVGTKKAYAPVADPNILDDLLADTHWMTVYADNGAMSEETGGDEPLLGTFKITAVGTESDGSAWDGKKYVALDRSEDFPDPGFSPHVRWVAHEVPDTTPTRSSGGGTEISAQYVRFRLYDSVTLQRNITIPWSASPSPIEDGGLTQVALDDDPMPWSTTGHRIPYRIIRPGVWRASSSAVEKNRDGALYYVELPLVGYGPSEGMNITIEDGLILKENYRIAGYTLRVQNEIFTFSEREEVSIILPTSVLPPGSTPGLDNELSLAGQSIQLTYSYTPLVEEVQQLFNSDQERVAVANALVRHFLPSYVSFDVYYTGGDDENVVATALIDYINHLPPENNKLNVDKVNDLIKKHGATKVVMPIVLMSFTHGVDRRIRGVRTRNVLGSGDPSFAGTYMQSYLIAGPDTSKMTTRPNGEQIYLKRY